MNCSICNEYCHFCSINSFICAYCIDVSRGELDYVDLPFRVDAPEFVVKMARKHKEYIMQQRYEKP